MLWKLITVAVSYYRYSWLSNDQLLDLPIPELLCEGAVVAVWVTNKRSIAQFVRERLFPHWAIQYTAEWHWIKVYTSLVPTPTEDGPGIDCLRMRQPLVRF